tara:strand:- start:1422 stop:1880 length:459 start_codon:yes stop_codon:yes gene_type:complete
MPSYPAKPYVVPHDDWFDNISSNFENKSKTKEAKNISTIHEFFYRKANIKVGGSENQIQTNLEKISSTKIINSSLLNINESLSSISNEKNSYSNIPTELKLIKKRSFKSKTFYKNSTNKNKFNLRSYFLGMKSFLLKIIRRKKEAVVTMPDN